MSRKVNRQMEFPLVLDLASSSKSVISIAKV